jgi:hypothetical protein
MGWASAVGLEAVGDLQLAGSLALTQVFYHDARATNN